MAESKKTVKVTLVKSPIGTNAKQRATLAGLGLKKLHQSRELEDTPAVRGMITKVAFLAKKDAHRVGRGVGSGWGKTAGRGHKGQKSRAGGFHKVGFEGGQMPLHRRLPKRGFTSLTHKFVEMIRLSDLEALPVDVVTIDAVRQAGLIGALTEQVRVIAAGKLTKKVTVQGLKVTKGAKAAIEAAGGSVAE